MKDLLRVLLFTGSFLLAAPGLRAEDSAIRSAQTALRELGLYRGEISGVSSVEFRGAVRRFQQQNGLDTTGELTGTTREALREATQKEQGNTIVAVGPRAEATPVPVIEAPEPTVVPPAPIPPAHSVVERDRAFLESSDSRAEEEEYVPRERPATPVYAEEQEGSEDEGEPLLAGSVYEEAEPRVQADVLRRAESILRRQGLLGVDDPQLSPDARLEEALFRYQSAERIRLTGLLDNATLASMRLLPRQEASSWERSEEPRRQVEIFRGRVPRSSGSSSDPYPNAVRGIPLN